MVPKLMHELKTLLDSSALSFYGIVPAAPGPEYEALFRAWLAAGYHGTMQWLEKHAEARYHPEALLSGSRSIIIGGLSYYQKGHPLPENAGAIARYAWGRDYHKVFAALLKSITGELKLLFPGALFRSFCDTSPVPEKHYAALSGTGFIGRNSLFIHPEYGSYTVLGGIITTLALPEHRSPSAKAPGSCGSCRACVDACPTGAILDTRCLDASRCLSYLTIEHEGPLPDFALSRMGQRLYGCDICQEVCPFNKDIPETAHPDFLRHTAGPFLQLDALLAEDDPILFKERYAASPLARAGLVRLQRSAKAIVGISP